MVPPTPTGGVLAGRESCFYAKMWRLLLTSGKPHSHDRYKPIIRRPLAKPSKALEVEPVAGIAALRPIAS